MLICWIHPVVSAVTTAAGSKSSSTGSTGDGSRPGAETAIGCRSSGNRSSMVDSVSSTICLATEVTRRLRAVRLIDPSSANNETSAMTVATVMPN